MKVIEKAYAKINLTLDIGEERVDHYHEVKTIMVPVDLYDTLEFEKIDSGILLLDNTTIKATENFVYKAAKLFMETYKITEGVKITLYKNIPSEAGLGGGSADAAACLRGLNRLFGLEKSLDELAQLSMQLGSDMPFCVYNHLAYCTDRGNEVSLLDVKYNRYYVLIIKPPFGLSTKKVYDAYKVNKREKDSLRENVIKALETDDVELLNTSMFNDLEDPAFALEASLLHLKNIIAMEYTIRMSGSGTALFGISKDKNLLINILEKHKKYNRCILTKLL